MCAALQMFHREHFLTSCSSHVICIPESKHTTGINLTENALLGCNTLIWIYIARCQSRLHIISRRWKRLILCRTSTIQGNASGCTKPQRWHSVPLTMWKTFGCCQPAQLADGKIWLVHFSKVSVCSLGFEGGFPFQTFSLGSFTHRPLEHSSAVCRVSHADDASQDAAKRLLPLSLS